MNLPGAGGREAEKTQGPQGRRALSLLSLPVRLLEPVYITTPGPPVSLSGVRERPGGRDSFEGLLLRASKLSMPQPMRAAQIHSAEEPAECRCNATKFIVSRAFSRTKIRARNTRD
jgi:hypothetical protein